jgi:hypothetical protein
MALPPSTEPGAAEISGALLWYPRQAIVIGFGLTSKESASLMQRQNREDVK